MKSASSSRLNRTPFPVRKLREMSAGFRSFVNLKKRRGRVGRGGEGGGGEDGYVVTLDHHRYCIQLRVT